jgi:hypothetical protein
MYLSRVFAYPASVHYLHSSIFMFYKKTLLSFTIRFGEGCYLYKKYSNKSVYCNASYNKWWGLGWVCTCYDATTSSFMSRLQLIIVVTHRTLTVPFNSCLTGFFFNDIWSLFLFFFLLTLLPILFRHITI